MKRLITILLFVFCVIGLKAQMVIKGDTLVGNEWIDYDKAYIKIKIAENGVYKITGAELEAAGMETSQKEAIYLQMMHNGNEIPIYTSVSGLISADSYIEFYGEKNTIALDSFMYKNWNQDLLNPKYSLISDTSVYFLTFADSNVDRKRYKTIVHNYETNVLSPEPYFYHESFLEYHNAYFKPTYRGNDKIKLSNFVSSEGFSKGLSRSTKITIPTPKVYKDEDLPSNLNYRMGSNGLFFNSKEYRINGELIKTDTTSEYDVVKGSFPLLNTSLSNSIEFQITNIGQNDQHMLAIVTVDYPRSFSFSGENNFTINLGAGKKYIELENFDFGTNNIVLDPNNSRRYFISDRGNDITGIIIDGAKTQQIELYANAKPVAKIEKTTFENPVNWNPNYIIISSEKLYNTLGGEREELQE